MRKTYDFLKKLFPIILAELLIATVFGVLSFSLCYDKTTSTLKMPSAIVILLIVAILVTIATVIFTALMARNIGITRIKKNNPFLISVSAIVAVIALVCFIYDAITSIKTAQIDPYYLLRLAQWIFLLPLIAYFVLEALPSRIGSFKLHVPMNARVGVSVCAIAWAVLGILCVYFNELLITDITKISVLLSYSVIALFLVFEGQLENVKPRFISYIIGSAICATLALALPFGITMSKMIGTLSPYGAFSVPSLLLLSAIGIYAIAKMVALLFTVRAVLKSAPEEKPKSDGKASENEKQESNASKENK